MRPAPWRTARLLIPSDVSEITRLNALSLDLEDWYHPELVRARVPPGERVSRVEEAVLPLLALLQENGVKATVFVVGEVAREHPELIRRIHQAGHELGCHGMTHEPLWALTPQALDRQLAEFAQLMAELVGDGVVRGFRAPSFSLDNSTRWALPVLRAHGYCYDSSVFGFKTPLYGLAGSPLGCYRPSEADLRVHDPRQALVEVPVALLEVAGRRLPVGGGSYLRLLPYPFLQWAWRRIQRARPLVIYLHPWETSADTPRRKLSLGAALLTYYGLDGALARVRRLLQTFRFGTIASVVAEWCAVEETECRG